MTTFTLKDYVEGKIESKDAEVMVEPIPFAGYVNLQDKQDTEAMLRQQVQVLQAENQRLKRKLRALGENE